MKAEVQGKLEHLMLWQDKTARSLLRQTAVKFQAPEDALAELLAWEIAQQERGRADNRRATFDDVLGNTDYWKE
ncbi:hypothetical protein L1D53_26250 [Vibrio alginolyticus]|nr:hypothetical protein [Vibrio alginolyticus]